MKRSEKIHETKAYLQQRVKHLEEMERSVVDALDLAASLGDFQTSINKLRDIPTILEETRLRIKGLIPCDVIAFFLVEENSQEFVLKTIDGESQRETLQREVDRLIDDGTFAWALNEKRPLLVTTKGRRRLLLHVLATAARIRGMCVGLLSPNQPPIFSSSLSLLSLILLNGANAIESFELHRAIREIRSNLERIDNYRTLFEAAPDGVEVLDTEGRILDCNESQQKLLEMSREQLVGSLSRDHFADAEEGGLRPAGQRLPVAENGYWEGEVELVTGQGRRVPVWRKEKAIRDKEGRFIGVTVYNRDLSRRRQSEARIRLSEERLRKAQSIAHVGDFELDLRTMNLTASAEAFRIYGVEPTVAELPVAEVKSYMLPESRIQVERDYQGFLTNRQGIYDQVFQIQRADDGRTSVIHSRAELVLTDEGTPIRVSGVIQDITERKRLEEDRINLEERLHRAEKMEALGTLAGGVAHDLNNVLGVVVGYAEMLALQIPEGTPARKYAVNILNSSEKGASIIEDLLTLARRGVPVSEVINLNAIIHNFFRTPVFERLKEYHPGVVFETGLDPELLNIKGSPLHLEKTVMNLISNAAEAIAGEGAVTIRTENRYLDRPLRGYDDVKEGDYAVLIVSDNGGGIPAADLAKIFEPFYTKKVMGRSGTGLGLAVVWGTVKDHHGYIDVRSEDGKSSCFTLYFPVTREEASGALERIPVEKYQGRGEKILVIDDVPGQREMAVSMLESLGYRVSAVASGEEAVEYLKGHSVDLLVLDMIMDPGIDGLETYRRILKFKPGQKAIIVSGFAETDRVREVRELGAGAYIRKPYIQEKIGLAIRQELAKVL